MTKSYHRYCSCKKKDVKCDYKPDCYCGKLKKKCGKCNISPYGHMDEVYCWNPCDNYCCELDCWEPKCKSRCGYYDKGCGCDPCEDRHCSSCKHKSVTKTYVYSSYKPSCSCCQEYY